MGENCTNLKWEEWQKNAFMAMSGTALAPRIFGAKEFSELGA
jgi:hypothetical protein